MSDWYFVVFGIVLAAVVAESLLADAMWPWMFNQGILAIKDDEPWPADMALSPGFLRSTDDAFIRVISSNKCIFIEPGPPRRSSQLRGTLLWKDGRLQVLGRHPVSVGFAAAVIPAGIALAPVAAGNLGDLPLRLMVAAACYLALRVALSGASAAERDNFFRIADGVKHALDVEWRARLRSASVSATEQSVAADGRAPGGTAAPARS
jgi:hypothetical protein